MIALIGIICRYISMYPSSDGNHLSLFLKMKYMNDLPEDSGKLVQVTLSIKDQETAKHHKISGMARWQEFAKL
jgi:hypothetical protein